MTEKIAKCNTTKNQSVINRYLSKRNPYESVPSMRIDLVALTRYAKENNKTAKKLSPEEIALFKNQLSEEMH